MLHAQFDSDSIQIEEAYTMLKTDLGEAAQSEGVLLEDLMQLPDKAEDIITILPNA